MPTKEKMEEIRSGIDRESVQKRIDRVAMLEQQKRNALRVRDAAQEENDFEAMDKAYELVQRINVMLEEEMAALPFEVRGNEFTAVAEPAMTMLSGMIAEPLAGAAGLAQTLNPFAPAGAGADTVAKVRHSATYEPRTMAGQEGLRSVAEFPPIEALGTGFMAAQEGAGDAMYDLGGGSPLLGAIGASAPTAALEMMGLGSLKGVSGGMSRMAQREAQRGSRLLEDAEAIQQGVPTQAGMREVGQTMAQGDPEQIARMLDLNPEFFRAQDELGITAPPQASYATRNPQYIDLEQGLASIPASPLAVQHTQYLEDLSRIADGIIERGRGSKDKAGVSQKYKNESLKTIEQMYKAEERVWRQIKTENMLTSDVTPSRTVAWIEKKARQLGGIDKLPSDLKTIYYKLNPKESRVESGFDYATGDKTFSVSVERPTYGMLDDIRSRVGEKLGGDSDPFPTASRAEMKSLYAALKEDQKAAIKDAGKLDLLNKADEMTKSRKALEENLADLLGKDLERDLIPVLERSMAGMARGNITQFVNTLNKIPRAHRAEALSTALDSVFRGNARGVGDFNPASFYKFMRELDRNPALKTAIYKDLPKSVRTSLDNLYIISEGVAKATAKKVPTGRVGVFFESDPTFFQKLMNMAPSKVKRGVSAAEEAGGTIGLLGHMMNKADNLDEINKMLASSKFQTLMYESIREGIIDGNLASDKLRKADAAFRKSEAYKAWEATLDPASRTGLSTSLVIPYLFGMTDEVLDVADEEAKAAQLENVRKRIGAQ